VENNISLTSIYSRIKKNCCPEWQSNYEAFKSWYENQTERQGGVCFYCHLPGNTNEYYGHPFRDGRRGKRLEVDRIESKGQYSPDNCVLACYPCNNAKSDVFTYAEFIEIGKVIKRVKTRLG